MLNKNIVMESNVIIDTHIITHSRNQTAHQEVIYRCSYHEMDTIKLLKNGIQACVHHQYVVARFLPLD